jgi:hypothetical protein
MKKINIAKLLENCPSGMELDCTVWKNLYFEEIINSEFPVSCYFIQNGVKIHRYFTEYGHCYYNNDNDKCVIFPKGKDTWEGFVPPCKFKDGDILAYDNGSSPSTVFIYRYYNPDWNTSYFVALSGTTGKFFKYKYGALDGYNPKVRFATEEEKQRLFKAIEDNGYKWNEEKKTLEELPKFKVGDKIKIKNINYTYTATVTGFDGEYYSCVDQGGNCFSLYKTDTSWELIPNKLDILTLKPFDRVLGRNTTNGIWKCDILSNINKDVLYEYECVGYNYKYCIPYEGNEHLLGTKDDCDDFYKTWEE